MFLNGALPNVILFIANILNVVLPNNVFLKGVIPKVVLLNIFPPNVFLPNVFFSKVVFSKVVFSKVALILKYCSVLRIGFQTISKSKLSFF